MSTLYCLTDDLYQDMQIMASSPFFGNKNLRGPVLKFQPNVDVIHEFDLLIESAKMVMRIDDYWGEAALVTRKFFPHSGSLIHTNQTRIPHQHISLHTPYVDNVLGEWWYTYAMFNFSTLVVSTTKQSGLFLDGKYIEKESSGKEVHRSLSEIVASQNKDLFDQVIPPDKEMFSASKLRYRIPERLLK